MSLRADFHNHSCLSPCGSLELSPQVLAARAKAMGLEFLALTDHNSALNCPAFSQACTEQGIVPLYGLEATTQEEVHVLCLFPFLDAALAFGELVYSHLFPIPNRPERFGDQVWVDEQEYIGGEVELWLGGALDIGVDDIAGEVDVFGGLCIPAHIDRPAFSMTSQLGFVVKGPWAALECIQLPPSCKTGTYPLITSSDAHYPENVGCRAFNLDITKDALIDAGVGGRQPPSGRPLLEARGLILSALASRPRGSL